MGLLVSIFMWNSEKSLRDVVQVVYGFLNIILINVYIEYWKQKSEQFSVNWQGNLSKKLIYPI